MPFAATVAGTARRPALALLLAVLALLGGTTAVPASVTAATTPASLEASLLTWTNRDRAALGLRPLRLDGRLAEIAGDRAANLVASGSFSHQAAGSSLSTTLDRAGVQWYAWSENIGWWGGGPTLAAASALYGAWRASAHHWAALMSASLNYVGFGVAHRPSDGRLFASAVLTESKDHTTPRAKVETVSRSGTAITFTWRGWDPVLQSHGAGLRDFDVWYRVDAGAWRLVRDNTTATSLRLTGRASGHRYWLAVRPRDRALNIGPLSSPLSVWVP
jgi:uncharacterized protein YkwD